MLQRILHRIADRRQRQHVEIQNPTAAKVRTLVPRCLVCNAGPAGHRFAAIASMPCSEETRPRVMALFNHVKNREWESLHELREFRADQDDAVVYAVIGPHEGGMVVLIRDPVELYARFEMYIEEAISGEEVRRIRSLVSEDEWAEL